MRKSTLLILLAVVSFAASACSLDSGPHSSPERVARACIDAINARDEDRFVSLYAPDRRDNAAQDYDRWVNKLKVRFGKAETIVVRDNWISGKDVTVLAPATLIGQTGLQEWDQTTFNVEHLDVGWYISFMR